MSNNGLGLVASKNRRIASGESYNSHFTQSKNTTKFLGKSDNDSDFTAQAIVEIIKKYAGQTKNISQKLKGQTVEQSIQNAFNFTFKHIAYREDGLNPARPQAEELHSPNRIWHQKYGDCDDYAIFIGTILYNLNIPFALKRADYGKGFQHIYLVVPRQSNQLKKIANLNKTQYFTIDPVLDTFNQEAGPIVNAKYNTIMGAKVYFLEGVVNTDAGDAGDAGPSNSGETRNKTSLKIPPGISQILTAQYITTSSAFIFNTNSSLKIGAYTPKVGDAIVVVNPKNNALNFIGFIRNAPFGAKSFTIGVVTNLPNGQVNLGQSYAFAVTNFIDDFIRDDNWLSNKLATIRTFNQAQIVNALQDSLGGNTLNSVKTFQNNLNPITGTKFILNKTFAQSNFDLPIGTTEFLTAINSSFNLGAKVNTMRNAVLAARLSILEKLQHPVLKNKTITPFLLQKFSGNNAENIIQEAGLTASTRMLTPIAKNNLAKTIAIFQSYVWYLQGKINQYQFCYFLIWQKYNSGVQISPNALPIFNDVDILRQDKNVLDILLFTAAKPEDNPIENIEKNVEKYITAWENLLQRANSLTAAADQASKQVIIDRLQQITPIKFIEKIQTRFSQFSPNNVVRLTPPLNVTFTTLREGIKMLLRLNVFGFATTTSLPFINYQTFKANNNKNSLTNYLKFVTGGDKFFRTFARVYGGKTPNLIDAINAGKNKKPIFVPLPGTWDNKLKNYVLQLQANGLSGLGVEPATTTTAATSVAATATFWDKVAEFIKNIWDNGGKEKFFEATNNFLNNSGGAKIPINKLIGSGKGSIAITGGNWSADFGVSVTVTATPDSGFVFDYFEIGLGKTKVTTNPHSFNVSQNNSVVRAFFKAVGGNGGGDGNGGDTPPPPPPPPNAEGGITAKQIFTGLGIAGGLALLAKVFSGGTKSLKGTPKQSTSNSVKNNSYKV